MARYQAALVTGGVRRIGRAIASHLVAQNIPVAIHSHSSIDDGEAFAAELCNQGGRALYLQADLSDLDAASQLVSRASKSLDAPIDLLVNNAASFESDTFGTVDGAQAQQQINLNMTAPILLMDAMARQDLGLSPDGAAQGLIINILDQKLKKLTPGFVSYTVAKSGLWTATQMAAQALAPTTRVNGIALGSIMKADTQSDEHFDGQRENRPLRYDATTGDIAAAVSYLMSAHSVTGQMLAIDSGQHLNWRTSDLRDST